MKRTALIISMVLMFGVHVTSAAPAAKNNSDHPITIKSNELRGDSKNKTATFIGRVVAKQNDITIYTDKMVVRYAEQGGQVDKVEAYGNVRIVQGNRVGTGQTGVYYSREGKIILSGKPKVIQGKDIVTGKEITYYLNEEKSLVTGGPDPADRVIMVINPKGKEKNDAGKQ
jgi:lipopolysaccharide export system protein LptA